MGLFDSMTKALPSKSNNLGLNYEPQFKYRDYLLTGGMNKNMGFFKSKTTENPRPILMETPWGNEAKNYYLSQLYDGNLSSQEQAGIGILDDIIAGKAFNDPYTGKAYSGLRQSLDLEQQQGVNQMRRRSQLAGMGSASTAAKAEGAYTADMAAKRNGILAGLYLQEINRDNPYTRLSAAMNYGGLQRNNQQQAASTLLNYNPWYTPTYTTQPSMFSSVFNGGMTGAQAGSAFGPYGALFGGIAGGAGGAMSNYGSQVKYPN